jgi:hypothetical protein
MEWVEENGTAARGKREYLAFLRGQYLTLKQRVLANCYECTGMYTDGREDCKTNRNGMDVTSSVLSSRELFCSG